MKKAIAITLLTTILLSARGKKEDDKRQSTEVLCNTGRCSQSISCFLKKDFQVKPYAAKEGECDKSIPFPLPKFDK